MPNLQSTNDFEPPGNLTQPQPTASKKSYRGITKALDYLFTGKESAELVTGVLDDLSSGKSFFSMGTRVLWFGIKHPVHTYNLMQMENYKNAFSDSTFQKALLENENTWKFVSTIGSKLPTIGKILGKLGIEFFKDAEKGQKGGILDGKSLKLLGETLKDPKSQQLIKEVALAAITDPQDQNKVILHTLELMANGKHVEEFFKLKSEDLKNYAVKAMVEKIAEEIKQENVNKNITGQLQETPGLNSMLRSYGLDTKDLKPLAEIIPILLNKPAELKEIYILMNKGDYTGMVKAALSVSSDTPGIKKYFENNQQLFSSVLEKVIAESPALLGYNLSGKIYDIVPLLLNHPEKMVKLIEHYEQGKITEVGKEFLDLAKNDEKIQNYLTQNKIILKGAINKSVLGAYEIDDKVLGIVDNLIKPQNLEQFPKLINLFEQGKMTGLVIETCRMIENDPSFTKYILDNQKNFGEIFNAVINQQPEIQKYFGTAEVGSLISNMIKDPKTIRLLVEAYDSYLETGSGVALAYAGVGFLKNKALDSNFRSAAYNAASGWIFGDGANKQDIVNKMVQSLADRDAGERLNLTEIGKTIAYNAQILDNAQKDKLQQAADKNSLFDGVSFDGKRGTLFLNNLEINGNKFVGSTFNYVSFKDCKLTNTSFAGAKFKDVDFRGSEIDGATLQSLRTALKHGEISLVGAKIIGDIPADLDLSYANLKGVDLSKVTSMQNVNLEGTNFTDAILPDKLMILSNTYNLNKAAFDEGALKKQIISAQKQIVIEKVVENFNDISPEGRNLLEKNLKDLYLNKTIVGENFKNLIEATPLDLTNTSFPLNTSKYSHVSDYKDKTAPLLEVIYQNRNNPKNIANIITANIIADRITENLFKNGDNRGQDGQTIRTMMAKSLDIIIKDNPNFTYETILKSENFENMITLMTKDIKAVTVFTTVGKTAALMGLEGGIQLSTVAANQPLITKLATYLGDTCQFSKEELAQIQKIAEGVGKNIYGSRAKDIELVFEGVKEMVSAIKAEYPGTNLCALIEKERENITGVVEITAGYMYNSYSYTGLTKAYQAISPNTTFGLASGGVYLDELTAKRPELLALIKAEIINSIGINLKIELDIPSQISAAGVNKGPDLKDIVRKSLDPLDHHKAIASLTSDSTPNPNLTAPQKPKISLARE